MITSPSRDCFGPVTKAAPLAQMVTCCALCPEFEPSWRPVMSVTTWVTVCYSCFKQHRDAWTKVYDVTSSWWTVIIAPVHSRQPSPLQGIRKLWHVYRISIYKLCWRVSLDSHQLVISPHPPLASSPYKYWWRGCSELDYCSLETYSWEHLPDV